MSRALTYRPDIDGLRALAVLPVLFYHAGVPGFAGGFVGVDVFFVVSGFLITSIIVSEQREGRFSLARFYERRARRILPALFLVVAFSVPLALVILVPENLEDFGQSVIASALFVSNFFFYLEDGYFEGPAELHPLLHTWSLAVEEQFYLLLPLLLLLAFRRGTSLPWLLGTTALASFAFADWQVGANNSAAFYLLPARLWELMIGSLLAVTTLPRPATAAVGAGVTTLGIGLILLAVGTFDELTPFPGSAALLPCLGAALIIYGGQTDNAASRFMALPPWRGIGLISYSLYLWHFPLLVFARHLLVRPFTALEIVTLLSLTALLSFWSWRCVEQPFRRAERIPRRTLFRGVAAAVSLAIVVGLFTDLTDGAEWRFSETARGYLAAKQDRDSSCLRRGERCELGPPGEPRYVVWGDSHAGSMLAAFQVLSEKYGVPGKALLRGGCPPLKGYYLEHVIAKSCKASIERTLSLLEENAAIDTVFLAARWTKAVEQSPYGFEGGGAALRFCREGAPGLSNAEVVELALDDTLTAISRPGRRVYLIGPIPEVGWHVPATMAQRERLGSLLDEVTIAPTQADFDLRNGRTITMLQAAAARHGATVLRPDELLCADGSCRIRSGGALFYHDTDHLTKTGARELIPLLAPVFPR